MVELLLDLFYVDLCRDFLAQAGACLGLFALGSIVQ